MQPAPSTAEATGKEIRGFPLTRHQVLTEVIATHATQDPTVIQFREEVLQGGLLSWNEIQGWIIQQRERETEQELPRLFLKVPLPPSHDYRIDPHGVIPDPPVYVGESHPAWGWHREGLEYAIPNSHWVESIPIAYGGMLARLQQLSTELAKRYQWQPALATVFVLTGLMPVLLPIKGSSHPSEFETHEGTVTALSRIVLTIDPTLTPKEVSTAFQRIRQQILGAKWRDLGERQLALARFALHREDAEPWTQRMEAWNKDFDEWPYPNVGNFKRDCQNAIEKLLAPIAIDNLFP